MGDAGPQAVPRSQIVLKSIEPVTLTGRQGLDDRASYGCSAVVDVVESGVGVSFLVAADPGSVGNDVRSVPGAGVPVDGHDAIAIAFAVENSQRFGIVEGEVTIAVGHEKGCGEQIEGATNGAGRAEQVGSLVGPLDRHPEADPVADMRANLVPQMGHTHDHVPDPALRETLELPVHEWPLGHLEHRFRKSEGRGPHPSRQTTRENDRLHAYGLPEMHWFRRGQPRSRGVDRYVLLTRSQPTTTCKHLVAGH